MTPGVNDETGRPLPAGKGPPFSCLGGIPWSRKMERLADEVTANAMPVQKMMAGCSIIDGVRNYLFHNAASFVRHGRTREKKGNVASRSMVKKQLVVEIHNVRSVGAWRLEWVVACDKRW
jgi:hypothetical protein